MNSILSFVAQLARKYPAGRDAGEKVKQSLAEMSQAIQTSLTPTPGSEPIPPV
jgi:hypothetical protein